MKLIVFTLALAGVTACSVNQEGASSLLDAPSISAAEFKLYPERNVTPNPLCDLYTSLSLRNGPQGPEAMLVNRLGGTCELAVIPNERVYQLSVTVDGCGAKIYEGSRLTQEGASTEIEIIDNRTNTCEIPIPALVVVNERVNGSDIRLYSHDAPQANEAAFRLSCSMTDTSARPYLGFLVKKAAGAEQASITYIRSAFFGSEEVIVEREISGCQAEFVRYTEISDLSVYVECDADGDAGYLSVERSSTSERMAGHMVFPNTGVEGYDDTSIPVSCW